jgi:phenylacetate-CoA ligase
MDLIAPLARHVVAPLWAKWERSPYLVHYRRMLRTQYEPLAEIRAWQTTALRQLAEHAIATVPFWQDRFAQAGLQPRDIAQPEDLQALPLLTKADLRAQGERLLSTAYSQETLHRHATSGSTGVPVVAYRDEACHQFKRAATLRSDEWSGWRLGEKKAIIWGNPFQEARIHTWRGYLRNQLLDRCYFLDSLNINNDALHEFAATLRAVQPTLLFGHAHSLYLFAKYIEEHGPNDIRPRGAIATAMVLHKWERQKIESVFHCPVINRYGCEEVSLIACECLERNGLHINSDSVFVEILRADSSNAEVGECGRVVVTDLTNFAMPLMRYEIGDMAVLASERCPCGRTLPLIKDLSGRMADYVVTTEGKFISGISLTDHFNTKIPGVLQLQIIQEETDLFVYNIVRDANFSETSYNKVAELTVHFFGRETRYECRFLDKIPQEPSGKYRFCISKVDKRLTGTA